ncbi:thiamine pyrophosphate-binding protein [Rhodospirillaceae bacterium]|nr:thiamine pyrophosphate-binding protein [Rhodospirillaceae bacterium]
MKERSIADIFIDGMVEHDIRYLFCLPDIQNDDFFNAMYDRDNEFKTIHTRHEQGVQKRKEPAGFSHNILLWKHQYKPPDKLSNTRLARPPYLGRFFEFLEKEPGQTRHLTRIHDFTFRPTMSFGPSGCSISTLRLTVPMLVAVITRGIFIEDNDTHWNSLLNHPNMVP